MRETLAVVGFAPARALPDDPRAVTVQLEPWKPDAACEVWQVAGPVSTGRAGPVAWAVGGAWLLASILQPDEGEDLRQTTVAAYRSLVEFLRRHPDFHVQRIWNYLDRINEGDGDAERYRRFCAGRLEGMTGYFAHGFPAATAIGHSKSAGHLQIYCLASRAPGQRIENPRQISAWRYPRRYGPVSPSFARAMRLPAGDALAISGTAATRGHASCHAEDLRAQLDETLTNLESLRSAGQMPAAFGTRSPPTASVRRREHMPALAASLPARLPRGPRVLLHADIGRSELLSEIDGWHLAPGT